MVRVAGGLGLGLGEDFRYRRRRLDRKRLRGLGGQFLDLDNLPADRETHGRPRELRLLFLQQMQDVPGDGLLGIDHLL